MRSHPSWSLRIGNQACQIHQTYLYLDGIIGRNHLVESRRMFYHVHCRLLPLGCNTRHFQVKAQKSQGLAALFHFLAVGLRAPFLDLDSLQTVLKSVTTLYRVETVDSWKGVDFLDHKNLQCWILKGKIVHFVRCNRFLEAYDPHLRTEGVLFMSV